MQDDHADADQSASPSLWLRRVSIDDYSTVRHIHASAVRALADRLIEQTEAAAAVKAIYSPAYTTDLIAKSLYVALLNSAIVGTCAWSPSDDRGRAARISTLFVTPLFQGSGIARRLLAHVEQEAAHSGFTRLTAIAPVSKVPLFEGAGYVTASFGTSSEVVPGTALKVAFLRKPD